MRHAHPGRRWRALVAALAAATLAAGCANVPEESQPKAVGPARPADATQEVPQPAAGLDPLSVVRDFVLSSGQPLNDHAAARVYLDKAAQQAWRPNRGVTIIRSVFNTVYASAARQPADRNERVVTVSGTRVGKLAADNAFIPTTDPYELQVRLRLQPDGQWRIVQPPGTVVITANDFTEHYFRVPVYFPSQTSGALVPDLRYVAAKPPAGLPGKVVDLLLSGPSDGLSGAVRNPLGEQASIETNVRTLRDGALVVPLTGVGGESDEVKRLIAAQIVKSLQKVTSSRIRLLSDGSALVAGHKDWRPSELLARGAQSAISSELPGMYVLGGRVRSLRDGSPVAGPAGSGAYDVVSAAQSVGGQQLALVERVPGGGVRLRIGEVGGFAQAVDLNRATMTRPTWRPSSSIDSRSNEVWTVADGNQVIRVLRTAQGGWAPQQVDASGLVELGPITALRMSRDGTRVAVVAGGKLVIAAVVRDSGSVTLRAPRVLQGDTLTEVTDVDWAGQDTVIASTSAPSLPVARLPVDGLRMDAFNSANLTAPVRAVTAAPSRPIVVADASGLWTAGDVGEVWRPHRQSAAPGVVPFYPG